jgi:hypothetical protein
MASRRVVEAWRASGVPVEASTVAGEQFWATQELSTAPALIDATVAAVGAGRPCARPKRRSASTAPEMRSSA